MGFYDEIAKYYDAIFPVGEDQVEFLVKIAGTSPKGILDIACGSGGYSIELAKMGYSITSVDLDSNMIYSLKNKISDSPLKIRAMVGDMLELDRDVDQTYDLAFCIGNSVVHLDGKIQIRKFLDTVKKLLNENGKLVIQIINYDRIIMHNVKTLPTLENKEIGLKFERLYRYQQSENKIYFKTILQVDENEIENEISLYPLLSDDLRLLLEESEFKNINFYGSFKGEEYIQSSSFALVAVANN